MKIISIVPSKVSQKLHQSYFIFDGCETSCKHDAAVQVKEPNSLVNTFIELELHFDNGIQPRRARHGGGSPTR